MKKKKTYLLDTNVLMRYPNSIYGFDDNHVVVTAISIEELDKKKIVKGETGFQARQAIRKLDELREIALSTKKTLVNNPPLIEVGA
jgi:PhoH-like ATPase